RYSHVHAVARRNDFKHVFAEHRQKHGLFAVGNAVGHCQLHANIGVIHSAFRLVIRQIRNKKMFKVAVFLFTLGSLFCALSVHLLTLNLSRILQAIGGSMMVPIARLAILYQYPRSELLKIMNYITIPGLLGLVVGPSLGGFLSDNLSWHWIFLVNLPVGVFGI